VGGGPETLLLDVEARAAGHAFFKVVSATHSADGTLFAWAEDEAGAEKYTIFVKDLASGEISQGPGDAFGDFVLTPDSRWLFWTWRDEESRPARIYRRAARGGPDALVYAETDPAFLVRPTLSGSGRIIFIRSWNDATSEVRLIATDAPLEAPVLVERRQTGHLYTLEDWNDRFVILTNADGADDFKLMTAPRATPGRSAWREWLAEVRGRPIVEMRAFAGHFVRVDRIEGNPTIVVADAGGRWAPPVLFDEAAWALALEPSEYGAGRLRFAYQSPRTPRTWMDLDLTSGVRATLARQGVPGAPPPSAYVLSRLHATASDGARVPITVLHRAGLALDRGAPAMLTGYGAYGVSYETDFSIPLLSLVDRGWVWAVAHVRGGGEKGRAWFDAARGLSKKTGFTDFIACAEFLIGAGYCAAGRIAAFGYSAGGLLVGAANNMRPDLWGAVIGQAPFVDVLNTMSDASHPLVPVTRPVWGDPLASIADYDNIASYSPYDNVAAEAYPPVLATTAVADDRVGFWEPAKWIAALRSRSLSGAPMLLHTEMTGGHAGASGRGDELKEMARMYAFAIWALGERG
jgi:oligopeptidase B